MARGRRSLRLDEGGGHDEETPWPAFTDLALVLVLVLTLFILAQFLHYDRIFVLQRLSARQDSVQNAVFSQVDPEYRQHVQVDSEDEYHQRLTFQAELLFRSCRSNLRSGGEELVEQIGAAIRPFTHFFESIQVEGHTDIRPPGRLCPVPDNWVLSSERATAVVRILSESAFSGERQLLSAVGRGEHHPAQPILPSDTTSADLAPHRRIELLIQYTDEGILESTEVQ